MTLNSKSSSVKHIADPTNSNKLKLREPTLMISLLGESSNGYIRDSNTFEYLTKKTEISEKSKTFLI